MECVNTNYDTSKGITTSTTTSSSTSISMIQQEIETISVRLDQWCQQISSSPPTTVTEENATIIITTIQQLMELEILPFWKRHFHHNNNNNNDTTTNTTIIRMTDRMKQDLMEYIITKWLQRPSALSSPLSVLVVPSSSSSSEEQQQQAQQQQQQEQQRRFVQVQLLLRFVLLQWWGPLLVQVYNRMMHHHHHHSNTMVSLLHTKKKRNKKKTKKTIVSVKSNDHQHHPIQYSPFLQDMIQFLQWMAIRLHPHEPFVHFVHSQCISVIKTFPMMITGAAGGGGGGGGGTAHCPTLQRPLSHKKRHNNTIVSFQNESNLPSFLQPIWDYFEIQNPFHGDEMDDTNENTMDRSIVTTTTTTNNTTKRRRRSYSKIPPPQNISTMSTATTTSNTSSVHSQLPNKSKTQRKKNPLLGDKAKFVGLFFHSTTTTANRITTLHSYNHHTTLATSKTQTQNHKDAILSQLFRQVPVRQSTVLSTKQRTKSSLLPLNPIQSNTKPNTTVKTNIVTPPSTTITTNTSRLDQENTVPSITFQNRSTQSSIPTQLPQVVVMKPPAVMSVMSNITTNTIQSNNTTSSTRNLVAEAMEAIQRRKERRRQQQQM